MDLLLPSWTFGKDVAACGVVCTWPCFGLQPPGSSPKPVGCLLAFPCPHKFGGSWGFLLPRSAGLRFPEPESGICGREEQLMRFIFAVAAWRTCSKVWWCAGM